MCFHLVIRVNYHSISPQFSVELWLLFLIVFVPKYVFYEVYDASLLLFINVIVLGSEAISQKGMLLYRDCNLNLLSLYSNKTNKHTYFTWYWSMTMFAILYLITFSSGEGYTKHLGNYFFFYFCFHFFLFIYRL